MSICRNMSLFRRHRRLPTFQLHCGARAINLSSYPSLLAALQVASAVDLAKLLIRHDRSEIAMERLWRDPNKVVFECHALIGTSNRHSRSGDAVMSLKLVSRPSYPSDLPTSREEVA